MTRRAPEGWHEARLGEIATVNPRPQPLQPDSVVSFVAMADVSEQGYIISSSGRPSEELQAGLPQFQRNDTLVAKITPCFENGKGALVGALPHRYGAGSTEFHVVRPSDGADPAFLYWLTRSTTFRRLGEQNMTGSAGQRRVPTEFLKSFAVLLPPLAEQQKIAEILGSIDAATAATRRVIEQTRSLKRALMQKLLTRGIPGRHTRFRHSPLGRVPADWRVVPLEALLRDPIRNGYSPNCPDVPTGKWILSLSAVTPFGFNPTGVKPAPLGEVRVDQCLLAHGDLLVSRSNTKDRVGLVGIYEGVPTPCAYPDLLMRVRIDETRCLPHWLELVMLSPDGRRYFANEARGTSGSMVKVDRRILQRFPVPLPSVVEQREILSSLSNLGTKVDREGRIAAALSKVLITLSNGLISGEIRVPPAMDSLKSVATV